MKNILQVAFILILVLGLTASVFAQKSNEAQKKSNEENIVSSVTKEVEGTVSWVGKDKIAVTYNKDDAGTEYEILLPFDAKDLVLKHKKNLAEISTGDTVSVQYEEESIEYGDGKKEGRLKAKEISFVRSAPPKPKALNSDDEEDSLTFKGIK